MSSRRRLTGWKRAVAAAGVLCTVPLVWTSATFIDAAYLNLGGAGTGQFGTPNYDIQVSNTSGGDFVPEGHPVPWQQADDPVGVNVFNACQTPLEPGGHDCSMKIRYRNVAPGMRSSLTFKLLKTSGIALPASGFLNALRFDVSSTGHSSLQWTGLTYADLNSGVSLARPGTAGGLLEPGQEATLTLRVYLPVQATEAANLALNGASGHLTAFFLGYSYSY